MGDATGHGTLAVLYRQQANGVFSYLLARCGSRPLSEDLTAEVFIAAHRHLEVGRSDEVTPAWLRTVALRRLIDHWRREHIGHRRLSELWALAARENLPSSGPIQDRVEEALDSLPTQQRAVLVLRYLEGFSVTEVAESLGKSYKATESALSRARRSFEQGVRGDRMNLEELIRAVEPAADMTPEESDRVRRRIAAATGIDVDELAEPLVSTRISSDWRAPAQSPPEVVDATILIGPLRRNDGAGGGTRGRRVFVSIIAAAVLAVLAGTAWFATDRGAPDVADQRPDVVDAFRFRMDPGSVLVAAFGGATFESTLDAEVIQERSSLVLTSDAGTVQILSPSATADEESVTTVEEVVTALQTSGFELTDRGSGQLAGREASVFAVTSVSDDPTWALVVPAGDGLVNWSPVPGAELLIAETEVGVLIASLEPAVPGGPVPAEWGNPLVDSFELDPLNEIGG